MKSFFYMSVTKVTGSWDINKIALVMSTLNLLSIGLVIIRAKLRAGQVSGYNYWALPRLSPAMASYEVFPFHSKLRYMGWSLCSHSNM